MLKVAGNLRVVVPRSSGGRPRRGRSPTPNSCGRGAPARLRIGRGRQAGRGGRRCTPPHANGRSAVVPVVVVKNVDSGGTLFVPVQRHAPQDGGHPAIVPFVRRGQMRSAVKANVNRHLALLGAGDGLGDVDTGRAVRGRGKHEQIRHRLADPSRGVDTNALGLGKAGGYP